MTVELYQLIDANNEPTLSSLLNDYTEAEDMAKERNLAVEAVIFEYADSELVCDYRQETFAVEQEPTP